MRAIGSMDLSLRRFYLPLRFSCRCFKCPRSLRRWVCQILLNLSLIAATIYGIVCELPLHHRLLCMGLGVLLGGAIQLLVPSWDLYRQGWRPSLRFEQSHDYRKVRELFLPGLLGAGVVQLNLVLSRFLAYSLEDHAVSILFLASRLMELPLGVGTLADHNGLFPFTGPLGDNDRA